MSAREIPSAANRTEFDFNDLSTTYRPDYRPSIAAVSADQRHAYDRAPFASHFHPDVQPPILGFDPNLIQDDFDPFKLLRDLTPANRVISSPPSGFYFYG